MLLFVAVSALCSKFLTSSISRLECPNSLHFNSFNLQQSFYRGPDSWISKDEGTFGSVLSSFGFKVETDVGINERFASSDGCMCDCHWPVKCQGL